MSTTSRRFDRRTFMCWCVFALALVLNLGLTAANVRYGLEPHGGFLFDPTLHVTEVWPGAPFRTDDALVQVDGQTPTDRNALYAMYARHRVGDPVPYVLQRAGHEVRVVAPVRREAPFFWLQIAINLVAGLTFAGIGLFPFVVKPDRLAARVLLVQTAMDAAFFGASLDSIPPVVFPVLLVIWPLVGATVLDLGLVFPSPTGLVARKPWLRIVPYAVALILTLAGLGFLGKGRAGANAFQAWNAASLLWVTLALVTMFALLVTGSLRRKQASERQQAAIASWGVLTAATASIVLLALPDMIGWCIPVPLDWRYIVAFGLMPLFPASIAYAIVRARLFDIEVIVKRTLVYATATTALTALYFLLAGGTRWLSDVLFGSTSAGWTNVVSTAAVAIAFVPVRDRVQRVVDRVFHRNKYDFRSLIAQFSAHAKETLDLDELMDRYLDLSDEAIHAWHAAILLRPDPYAREMRVVRTTGASPLPEDFQLKLDRQGAVELAQAERTGLAPGKATTRQLQHLEVLNVAFTVPLSLSGEVLGLIAFGPKRSDLEYSAEDRELLLAMGQQLANSVRIAEMTKDLIAKVRLDQELATAKAIQASLLPSARAAEPTPWGITLDVAASSESAYEFGGDYYDLLPLDGGRLAVAVGDVAGKGVQAALVMAMAKSCLYNQIAQEPEAAAVVGALNRMITGTIQDRTHRKMTLLYGVMEAERPHFEFVSAGHQPPHLYRAAASACEALPIAGSFPLGASKLGKYKPHQVDLAAGDVLVFYTDGITEAASPDGETFFQVLEEAEGDEVERDRLREVLEAHAHLDAAGIHKAILAAVARFTDFAPAEDDRTLVVIKVGEAP